MHMYMYIYIYIYNMKKPYSITGNIRSRQAAASARGLIPTGKLNYYTVNTVLY